MGNVTQYLELIIMMGGIAITVSIGVYTVQKYLSRRDSPATKMELGRFREELKAELYRERELDKSGPNMWRGALDALKKEVEMIKASQSAIGEEQRGQLLEEIKSQLNEQAAQEVLKDIQSRLAESNAEREKVDIVESQFKSTIERLKEELFALSKRGNLNLSLGIVTTITGLVLLGIFLLTGKAPTPDINQFIVNFVPRISLVVFIEVFAYFFLRLYKSSLSEIKYFQNEITTIESKYLALKVAISDGESANIQTILDQLSKTERNFILDKGQSTVELERSKIDQQATNDILGKLTQLVSKNS